MRSGISQYLVGRLEVKAILGVFARLPDRRQRREGDTAREVRMELRLSTTTVPAVHVPTSSFGSR